MTTVDMRTPGALADAERWTAHNYHPLPVVIAASMRFLAPCAGRA